MGLLDEGAEYLRRSGRNLGGLFDFLGGNATAGNAAIKAGADATLQHMRGKELTPAQAEAMHNSPIGGFGPENLGAAGAMMGTYAGIGAKTANKQMLKKAQRMAAGPTKAQRARLMDLENTPEANWTPEMKTEYERLATLLDPVYNPDLIRQQTGWFQDPTGDWKFEISDHKARLKSEGGTLKLEHPELRRAYPDLLDTMKIERMPKTSSLGVPVQTTAEYYPSTNTAKLNMGKFNSEDDALKALMHEVQHGVQDAERYSPGTNQHSPEVNHLVNTEYTAMGQRIIDRKNQMEMERFNFRRNNPDKGFDEFYKLNPAWTKEYDALLAEARNLPTADDWAFQKYKSALGEVEARDTMNRLRMTPDERRRNLPYVGEGVPPEEIWDVRDVTSRLTKAADKPQELRGLLNRTLGPSAETKGMLGSLLALGLFPKDAE